MKGRYAIRCGRVLGADGWLAGHSLVVSGSEIEAIEPPSATALDASAYTVLPGIVDVHGDAFERQIMPRPGVAFDLDVAMLDTDRQLVANGITTAFHAMTWSWEPGLRGHDAALGLLQSLEGLHGRLSCDTRLHVRWETNNLDAETAIAQLLVEGRIGMLAFNDHTPEIRNSCRSPERLARYLERAHVDAATFLRLIEQVWSRRDEVPAAVTRLSACARAANVPMLSHDDDSPALRRSFLALGCNISEFPKNGETARAARDDDSAVIMGAPNVLRGGSHLGAVSASALVGAGLCTILSSDYYYPSLPQAPYRLARNGIVPLDEAWALVSRNPAAAAGMADRGVLAPGTRADFIVVDDRAHAMPRVVATFVAGVPVFQDRPLVARVA